MPDDLENWERVSTSHEKVTFQARKQLAGRGGPKQNPYRAEAERDRLIFRITMAILALVVLAFVLYKLVLQGGSN